MDTTKMITKMSSFIYNISIYGIHHQNILNSKNNIIFDCTIRTLANTHLYTKHSLS